ncbi:MAG TPA: MFS transporter [Tepidisphaeraceae bacterium]|jgi:MFS family permease
MPPADPDPNPSDPQSRPPRPEFELADPLADQDRPAAAATDQDMLEYESPAGRAAHDPYAALRIPAFRRFISAFFLSAAGSQIQAAAVGWQIYDRPGATAWDLGLLGLILAIPMLLLSLPAGQMADTFSRRKLFLFMQVSTTFCATGLMIMAWLFDVPGDQPWPPYLLWSMYGLLGLGAVGGTIGRPSREALMAATVPASVYPNAVTWNSTGFEISSMGGPAIGGLIVWLGGPGVAYAVASVFFVVAFVLILMLPEATPVPPSTAVPTSTDGPGRPKPAGLADLMAGIRFVFRSKLILAALTLDLFAVLFGGATFLLPIFAKDILNVGAFGFGCLRAAPAVGAVTMALVQAHLPPFKNAGRMLLWTVAGFGAATIVFGLSRNYALSFCMLVLTGAFDNISVVIRHSLVPLATPDAMRGRVLAVNQIFVGSSNELGGLESGWTAYHFGPVASVVGGGIASILVVIGVAAKFPEVRRLKSLHDVKPIEDETSRA